MEIGMPLAAGVAAVLVVLVVLAAVLQVPVKAVLELLVITKAVMLLQILVLALAGARLVLEATQMAVTVALV
jgi:H+/Cl- antiporter ClcA